MLHRPDRTIALTRIFGAELLLKMQKAHYFFLINRFERAYGRRICLDCRFFTERLESALDIEWSFAL
jgi:hypothetical protein